MKLSLRLSDYLEADGKELFLFYARWAFGIWLLYLGMMKWIGGPVNFIGYITKDFAAAWPPEMMVVGLGWIILVLEPLLGALLILGWRQRLVWLITADLMWVLLFGKSIVHDYPTVASNWHYCVFALAMGCMSPKEEKSVS